MFDKRNVKNLYALTPLQEGILFHSLMDASGSTYFEQACFNVNGQVNIPLFQQTWNELIRRHDVLRTIFVLKNVPQPLQIVLKKRDLTINVENLTHLGNDEQVKRIEEFRRDDQNTPFDLTCDLLIRINLFKRGDEFHTLVWSFHHIIMDGWSVSVLYEELASIYAALNQGIKLTLPEPVQFNAYIRWLKGRNSQAAQDFWKGYLDGYNRPTGLPRLQKNAEPDAESESLASKSSLQSENAIFTTKRLKFAMSPEISEGLGNLALRCEVTINTMFQALWGVVMASYNQCTDAVFGITVSGRPAEIQGIERMVGLFINAVPVRIHYASNDTFKQLLTKIQSDSTAARDFHYCSLADIQASTQLRHNLFDQLLVFENYPDPSDVLGESQMGLSLTDFDQFEQTNYDLTVEVFPGKTVGYDLMFNPAVFAEDVVNAISTHLERAAAAVVADEAILATSIPVLTEEEKKKYNSDIHNTLNINISNSDANNETIGRRLSTRFAPPENEVEEKLVTVWQEVLERTDIGIDDNFFEIGGHSLRATRIISRIHKVLSVEVTLQEFFRNTDIRTLGSLIQNKLKSDFKADNGVAGAQDRAGFDGVKARQNIPLCLPSQSDYEISHAQRRLWILDQMEEDFTAYNQSAGFLFEGRFDPKLFKEAVAFVANRHESLRTVFVESLNEPRQKVLDNPRFLFSEIDLSQDDKPEQAARQLASELPHQMFDLVNGPLWAATLLRLSPVRHVVLLNIHHIICDGWSLVILENEVLKAYEILVHGKIPEVKSLPLQYKDFAAWQNGRLASAELDTHRSYWHEKLQGEIPVLNLPTDFPRPLVRTYSGAVVHTDIAASPIETFSTFCNQKRVSLFTGLAALLKVLLFRYTGQQDIIIGSPVAGRDHADLEDQIGFFVNTLALRDQIEPQIPFAELVKQVSTTITDAFDHQLYPFDRLVEELNVLRDVGRSPIFDVMLVLQNNIGVTASVPGLEISEFDFELQQSQFDLTLIFSEGDNGLGLDINYNTDLFRRETIERMAGHFITLIESAIKEPETQISRLNILTQTEQQTLTAGFNTYTRQFPEDKTLADLFEDQVEATPDRLAVIYQDRSLSYRELNSAANAFGYYLRNSCGIKTDIPVAVLLNRSESVSVALLGILKAGGTYLPLDPESPFKRLEYILADSGAKVLITDDQNAELARQLNPGQIIDIRNNSWNVLSDNFAQTDDLTQIEDSTGKESLTQADNLEPAAVPTDLAYIIYTSGSTGEPKGVMVEHRSFANMILAQIEGFGINADDRVLQFATLMFDASMSEIFMALLCGAAVVMIDKEQIQDTARFIDYMEQKRITAITLPPVYLKMLNRHPLPDLRVLITAGEPAIREDALFYSRTKSYFNAYGPTETSVCTSLHKVAHDAFYGDTIPVGGPIANNAVFILDKHLNPVPIGVAGELCFAGVGLARGYLNRPDLTAEKFIANPFAKTGRMYRIGDLGRWLPTGDIEFLGRVDEQVKIRGFRIEPSEIAAALKTFPEVEDALVMVWKDKSKTDDHNHLAAYIVTASQILSTDLRAYLSERLPSYMIPGLFIQLDSFPLTINGKIDKRALPDPAEAMRDQIQKASSSEKSEPLTSLEKKILEVWQTLFNRNDISCNDDFFTSGGDSIKAIRMVALLREHGVSVRVKDIFKWTTISELAKHGAKQIQDIKTAIDSENDNANISSFSGRVPQTPIYRWFFDHFKSNSNHFNPADLFYSKTRLYPMSIEAALNAVVTHHDMLRLFCKQTQDRITLMIPAETGCLPHSEFKSNSKPFEIVDLRHLPAADATDKLSKIASDTQSAFDLFRPPLLKVILFQLADGDRLFIVIHHLLGDAVSWRILLEDLGAAYDQHHQGQVIQLPHKTDPFPIWAEALEKYACGDSLQAEKKYWLEVIKKPFGRLPVDNPALHDLMVQSSMADMDIVEIQWSREKTLALIKAANKFKAGVDRLLLAAIAWSCRCQHGHESTMISLESYGRPELFDNIDVSRTIGWFTATYPIVISASDENSKSDHLERDIANIDYLINLLPNNGIGWGLLKYMTPPETGLPSPTQEPYPEINFNYLGEFESYGKDMFKPASEDTGSAVASGAAVIHDLDINAAIAEGQLQIVWHYNRRRFTKDRILKMVQDFSTRLESTLGENRL